MLSDIDARVLELQPTIFGTNAHKYKYCPLVKHPEVDEDDDYAKQKMDFCKVKFEVDYHNQNIKTGIFVNKNGKPILQNDIQTISDIAMILTRNSEARFVITISKLWAEKAPKKGCPKEFGLTLKCKQLEVYDKQKIVMDFSKIPYFDTQDDPVEKGDDTYFDLPQHNDQEQVQYFKKKYHVII